MRSERRLVATNRCWGRIGAGADSQQQNQSAQVTQQESIYPGETLRFNSLRQLGVRERAASETGNTANKHSIASTSSRYTWRSYRDPYVTSLTQFSLPRVKKR